MLKIPDFFRVQAPFLACSFPISDGSVPIFHAKSMWTSSTKSPNDWQFHRWPTDSDSGGPTCWSRCDQIAGMEGYLCSRFALMESFLVSTTIKSSANCEALQNLSPQKEKHMTSSQYPPWCPQIFPQFPTRFYGGLSESIVHPQILWWKNHSPSDF